MRVSCSISWALRASFMAFLGLFAASLGGPEPARAQASGDCDVPSHGGLRWITASTASGENRIFYYTSPVIRCEGGVRIRADSARVYDATNYTMLFGSVSFSDNETTLTSDQAQYFGENRRLVAVGNAVITDHAEGSVITGHNMTLIRAGPEGGEDHLTVTGAQPHATLFPTRQEPAAVEAEDTAMVPPDTALLAQAEEGVALDTAEARPDPGPDPEELARLSRILSALDPAVRRALGRPVFLEFRRHASVPCLPPNRVAVRGIPPGIGGDEECAFRVVFGRSLVFPGLVDPSAPPPTETQPGGAALPPDSAAGVEAAAEGRLPITRGAEQPEALEAAGEGAPPPEPEERIPYEIDARRLILEGERYFRASGDVVVTRDSLTALADSLEYDQEQGAIFLHGNARITTAQTDLSGEILRLDIPQDEIREARAERKAVLQGEDLTLVAPIVTLFFTDGVMERLVAVRDPVADSLRAEMDEEALERQRLLEGAPPEAVREMGLGHYPDRPHGLAQDFALDGDSLEVLAPGEILREVWAMGRARGESMGQDSLNIEDTPELIRKNWLEGDTIVAYFGEGVDSVASAEVTADDPEPGLPRQEDEPLPELGEATEEPDSAGPDYRLERLTAKVEARSMYRMAPSDSTVAAEPGRFAIHYVVGDEITIHLNESGEAERMEVVGQTRGIHLEPQAQAIVIDSLAVPDTAGVVPPDTAAVEPPDTGRVAPPDTSGHPSSGLVTGLPSKGAGLDFTDSGNEDPPGADKPIRQPAAVVVRRVPRRAPGRG